VELRGQFLGAKEVTEGAPRGIKDAINGGFQLTHYGSGSGWVDAGC
jgi:hypothetical protein